MPGSPKCRSQRAGNHDLMRMARNEILSAGGLRCLTASGSGRLAAWRKWRQRVREIELKYRVEDLEALLLALKSRGIELSEPVFQDDQAYAPTGWQFGDSKLGVSFLRLRTVQGRHYFTLTQPAGTAQDCLEFETQVTDRQAMHHAALHMGYRPTVRLAKTRRTATL